MLQSYAYFSCFSASGFLLFFPSVFMKNGVLFHVSFKPINYAEALEYIYVYMYVYGILLEVSSFTILSHCVIFTYKC